jgi:hypothetical protein
VQLLILDSRDNIAIATRDLGSGQTAAFGDQALTVRDDVPRGHKVALLAMPPGTDVLRYGEVIGATTTAVEAGEHVHIHNLISKRIPGRAG